MGSMSHQRRHLSLSDSSVHDCLTPYSGPRYPQANLARADSGSSVPQLAPLPLHGDAGRIADLDPDTARARPIGAIDLLRNDASAPSQQGVREDDCAILGNVFIEQDAGLGLAHR